MLSQTTKLEAVNTLLDAIGETPVSSLNNTGLVDAVKAERELMKTSRQVQLMGWNFNTLRDFAIPPDVDGNITLPNNTLKVDPEDDYLDYVQVGLRLFDRRTNSFNIAKTVRVELTILRDFEELPESARNYIVVKAARRFQQKMIGSQELAMFDGQDEREAWLELLDFESSTSDYNMLTGSHHVSNILKRGVR